MDKESILKTEDLPREEVQIPEWRGSVFVRAMSGAERDKFESSVVSLRGKNTEINLSNIRAKLTVLTVVDEDGKRLFADSDEKAVGGKSACALDRIFKVAQRLSGLTDKDVEELSENLEPAQNGGSTSV